MNVKNAKCKKTKENEKEIQRTFSMFCFNLLIPTAICRFTEKYL